MALANFCGHCGYQFVGNEEFCPRCSTLRERDTTGLRSGDTTPEPLSGDIDTSAPTVPATSPLGEKIGYLRVKKGKEPGRVYELRKERFTIGKTFSDDILVSNVVAEFSKIIITNLGDNQYAVEAEPLLSYSHSTNVKLNSSDNHLMVNEKYPLQNGDIVKYDSHIDDEFVFFLQ